MSVKKNEQRGKWETRWREGGKQRSRLFDRKGDAQAWDLEIKRRRQLGGLASEVIKSRITLSQFIVEDYWPNYAMVNLQPDTRRGYLEQLSAHIEPRLGGYELREITPGLVHDFIEQMQRAGVGPASQRSSLSVLSGIMRRAVKREFIPVNPVLQVDKPKRHRRPAFQPLTPHTVETIRAILLDPVRHIPESGSGQRRRRAHDIPNGTELMRRRNALIVSMLAYAGLRPIEDRNLTWGEFEKRRLHVWATKTEQERWVDVLEPLAHELVEWRMLWSREVGIPGPGDLIVPRPDGGAWTREDWGNWRNRVWRPAAVAAGVSGDLRPYRLRGSFASLLLWSGESLPDVAEQDGHSVAVLAKHYTGVMKDMKGQPKVPAAEAILEARQRVAAGERTRPAVVTG